MSNDIRPAQLLADVMSRIYRNGYTTTSGGNLSLRDEAGNVWMTPSGLDKGALRQEDMVCITPAGEIRGRTKPSCEFYFHLKIYELRPEIKAVVHAHPSILVSLSLTHRVPDPLITPLDWDGGSIGLCGFAVPGSQRLMEEVGEAFLHGCDSVIMANHGAIAASNVGLEDAYRRFESVIRAAEREYSAKLWDRPVALTGGQAARLHVLLQPPDESFAAAGEELLPQREELAGWIRRAGQQKLFAAMSGGASLRIGEDDFLINADSADRCEMEPQKILRVQGGRAENGAVPEKTWSIHREIYRRSPELHAVITAYCPYITGILATRKDMDTAWMPESVCVLRRMPCIDMEAYLNEPQLLARRISAEQPVVGLRNGFLTVAGKTLKDAFDAMEVAEFSAKAVVEAAAWGSVIPLGEADRKTLEKLYGLN